MKKYTSECLKPIETDQLDDLLGENLLGKDYEICCLYDNIRTIGENNKELDSFPILIENLEKIIEYHKKEGANYIAIDYHVDHNTYITQGVKIFEDEVL